MPDAYLNRIATAVPPHDVHDAFLSFGRRVLGGDNRRLVLFDRLVKRAEIAHRYSFLSPTGDAGAVDGEGFYRFGQFPNTAARMRLFETLAPSLAAEAVRRLLAEEERGTITHLIVTSCTGLSAPGIDLELIASCGLRPKVERTFVGFMGCYAAINALKLARHIVRSEPTARVLTVNLELCTLHLQQTDRLDEMLSFLLFGDGCAAALISAQPRGARLESFHAALVPQTADLIRWHIREQGFDMLLSGAVPGAIRGALAGARDEILRGRTVDDIALWAVHPGGRTVLDAVEEAFALAPDKLTASRGVLHDYGNMSSGTVMFVLERLIAQASAGAPGCAMAFGPGLVAETMQFRMAA
ncbi:MAG: type III polyketide synthase [Alphaproteobacteria bacterium]|nr:type III polyketide synthase [Alphaproteobacteria bacterium]